MTTVLPDADRWVWVSMEHATFILGVTDGRVVAAPPIAWKMIHRIGSDQWRAVAAYCQKRKAWFAELPPASWRPRRRAGPGGLPWPGKPVP